MPGAVTIFLCGDLMTGRGIDQILPHPSNPVLYEPYLKNALGYVELAEKATGFIPRPADFTYIWGDALDELVKAAPDARIVNLETAITKSEDHPDKGINYRMNPENLPCLAAGGVDCCCLANNHILDWGPRGLLDTIDNLRGAAIKHAGAGACMEEAQAPAILEFGSRGRVIAFSFGDKTSGIPLGWAASPENPGVNLLEGLSQETIRRIEKMVQQVKRAGDVIIVSIHWGSNWDFSISREQRNFAHRLIDEAGVDVIHGHSSHHIKGIEVYNEKLIIYGCGDFLNDYEGIEGYQYFRGDLGLMYFATIDARSGALLSLQMTPTRIRHFRVTRATGADALWLKSIANRECRKLGTSVDFADEGKLALR
ncbi:MAG: CapA family protein [Deltaproteobacteria bacterium]|nr:CapA family protein [Deltaproteobacteria bacterium]